ncbi:MAG: ABC transporter ATP-binding protein [Spirochaetales bacterium]|uniref:ABC transporter ATP-binding protein n=1 Tax=Candidatus Thalassospirochaeta sargassi TaxID=3119039 RepID=A0AAJ1IEM1_9SPIO|nr:ABC transporter ATP-binding protein [Spirochaetales bacterium]
MSSALIQARDIVFGYEGLPVLKNVSLTINHGEVFCLLGPNGSGKTTLLDCFLGLNKPESGSITVNGKNLADLHPTETAQLLAYIPQSHQKNFPFTVFDVVLMGRTSYTGFFDSPDANDRKIASDVLENMGLAHLSDRDYTRLSGGESQLVLIARALAQEAPILVMDEPSSHLDFRNEMHLLEMIINIISKGSRSVVLTTHSPYLAFFLENRGIPVRAGLLENGKLTETGCPSSVLNPENMARAFNVNTAMISHSSESGELKSLIPINAIKES